VARREVTLPTWAAVLLPAVIGLVASLIGAGVGVWQTERQADRERDQRVVDRDLAAYGEVAHATRQILADWDANIHVVEANDPSQDPLQTVFAVAPSDVQALLVQDERALREATARVEVAGSQQAGGKAGDLEDAAGAITWQMNVYSHPDVRVFRNVPSGFELAIVRNRLEQAYDKFLAVARNDTRE